MKIPKPSILLLALLAMIGSLSAPRARAQVSVNFFYDNLSQYGEWVDSDYGYCWHPTGVADNWAPYTDGYWAYTDSGWTWVSYEDYGGIVYHYGRWAFMPGEGWVWVPGYTWAPAWVSWRTGGDYVGWAPLPPEARWNVAVGFGAGIDAHFDIGPGFFSFVRVGDFGAPALGPVIMDREQNVTIINNTTNVTNITTYNSTVYAGGPSYAALAAHSSRPIPTLKLVRNSTVGEGGKLLSHQSGNQLMVIAPHITAPAGGHLPPPPKLAKTLTGVKAEHGWAGVKDASVRDQLRNQFKQEGGGKLNARPVNPEEVKAVTERIKSQPKNTTETPAPTEKPKGEKTKDLLNTPATEETTPAPKKGKKSKLEEGAPNDESVPEATPKKSKKSKTPLSDESNAEETPKHSKSQNGSGLQPFISGDEKSKGGDEYGTPRPKKEYSDEEKPSKYSDKSAEGGEPKAPKNDEYQGRAPQPAEPGAEPVKGEKKGKKNKDQQQQGNQYPGQ